MAIEKNQLIQAVDHCILAGNGEWLPESQNFWTTMDFRRLIPTRPCAISLQTANNVEQLWHWYFDLAYVAACGFDTPRERYTK